MRSLRFHILPLLLLCCALVQVRGQSISLYDADVSNFPEIRSRFIAVDKDGRLVSDITSADVTITENGIPVSGVVVDCPPPTAPRPISAVLVCDRSASMGLPTPDGRTRLDLLKEGAGAFVRLLDYAPPTGVAVTSFSDRPSIVSDFSNSPDNLVAAINAITAEGGTEYTPAFIDPLVGGISLLATRPPSTRRVLIFLTDGEPAHRPDAAAIIARAKAANVEVYAVTIAMPMNADLRSIATATGGMWFGDINSAAQIRGVYQAIGVTSGGAEPCSIRWQSRYDCASRSARVATVTVESRGLSGSIDYDAPPSSSMGLIAAPSQVEFGMIGPPSRQDTTVTITARNGQINVTGADSSHPFSITDWGGSAPPFTLAAGESRLLTIRFAPTDSTHYLSDLALRTTSCPPSPIRLSGGTRVQRGGRSVYLISPVGGEIFNGCDSIPIRWGGVAAAESVVLDYSTDNGLTWHTIARKATGLAYNWMPPAPGTAYRVRVSTIDDGHHIVSTIAGGGAAGQGPIATDVGFISPTGVAAVGNILYVAESGGEQVWVVDLLNGTIRVLAGSGQTGATDASPATRGKMSNPSGVAFYNDTIYIADYSNHLIRRVDSQGLALSTLAGNSQSGFSGDGGKGLNAMLQFPDQLVPYHDAILFSDAGNNRIRRVDLKTGIITTIAGGGSEAVGSDGPATSIILGHPRGLAVQGDSLYVAEQGAHRIRRIDLKSGLMATVAGNGERGTQGDGGRGVDAQLSGPIGVAVYGSNLFITDTGSYRVRRVDLESGIISTFAGTGAPGFTGDGGEALQGQFNHLGQPAIGNGFLYLPDAGNLPGAGYQSNRIRSISLGRLGDRDTSAGSFTVARGRVTIDPAISAKRVNYGAMSTGAQRDSIISSAICNTGIVPVTIDSIRISGANPGDFQVVASTSEIPPGKCTPIEIRFAPAALGSRSADLIVVAGCATGDTIHLSGIGIPPCGFEAMDLVNFGQVVVNSASVDTVLVRAICNTGSGDLSGTLTLAPANGPFTIVSGGGAFSIGPGACHQITIRFAPVAAARVTATIDYGIAATCGSPSTLLFGQGIGPAALSVSDLAFTPIQCPSEGLDSTIDLYNNGGAILLVTGADLVQNNEGFSLVPPLPSPSAPLAIPPDSIGKLRIHFAPAATGSKSGLLRIASNIGTATVTLSGRRDSMHVAATSDLLSFANGTGSGFPRDSFVVVENRGTVPVEITGGSITGPDRGAFQFDGTGLPVTLRPGERDSLTVRALTAPAGNSLHATLLLRTSPSCDSGIVAIALVIAGERPELSASSPAFRTLACPDETYSDTTLLLRNTGGSILDITASRIESDPDSNFVWSPTLPISIAPGDFATIPIRFAPKSPGAKSATLVLTDNSPAGETRVPLAGNRGTVAYTLSSASITLTTPTAGSPTTGSLTITNSGTLPLTWKGTINSGFFTILSIVPPTAGPGESSTITLQFTGGAEGAYYDTLQLAETRCGIASSIPLRTLIGTPTRVVVSLPVDSAAPQTPVALPIRIRLDDADAFARKGARDYTTTLLFRGTILVPDSATGGTILAKPYDTATGTQRVVIRGSYTDIASDTLAILHCTAMLGDRGSTPLQIVDFQWDRYGVVTERLDGSFTVVGTCYQAGLRLVPAPVILRVRPDPIVENGVLDIELQEWMNIEVVAVNTIGEETRLAGGLYDQGGHSIPLDVGQLPSGLYRLVIKTPFAQVTAPMVVVR